jgi:inward rectifier potassium channel
MALRQRHSPPEDINRDLGLGSRVVDQSTERFLNRDGSFNVHRRHLSFWKSLSLYHHLLTISWTKFFLLLTLAYFGSNLLFACGYMLCGSDALVMTMDHHLDSAFLQAVFFSIQTSATIGYGSISPNGIAANTLVAVESFVGLFGFAIATGLLFARFSRPQAKVMFSEHAIVAPYRSINALEFRLANERRNELIRTRVTVNLSLYEERDGVRKRVFHPLALERQTVEFLPLQWIVVHPIDEQSPLFGMTQAGFDASDAEILVMLSAVDDTFQQTVYTRTSYKYHEVVWGAKYVDMFLPQSEGRLGIDLRKLHDYDRVPLNDADAGQR